MEEGIASKDASQSVPGMPEGQPGHGLLHVASAEEVVKAQKEAETKAAEAQAKPAEPKLEPLEAYLDDIFDDARRYKLEETDTQSKMIECLMRRNGEYDPGKLAEIKAVGSSTAFLPLTGIKCRTFEAFVHDIYMSAKRKRTWQLKPTPVSVIPDEEKDRITAEVMAKVSEKDGASPEEIYAMASEMRAEIISRIYGEALEKSENMSRLVHDQMIEGGWVKAMNGGIMNLSTLKAMVIKGPILRERTVRSGWKDGKIQYTSKAVPTFENVSPLDIYPSRYSDSPNGPPICEKVNLDRSSLANNRHKPGYQTDTIEAILMGNTGTVYSDPTASDREEAETRETQESSPVNDQKQIGSIIRGVEIWCSCQGRDLLQFGIAKGPDGKDIDAFLDYEITAITVGKRIVFVEFNTDPLKRRPYSVTGYSKEIGGFWYKSIPEILWDPQDIVNAGARNLVNNMGWASGPQTIIDDITRLDPSEDLSIYALKVWQGIGGSQSTKKLVEFYQPDSRSGELIGIIKQFIEFADVLIEMPSYQSGNDKVGGAGRTMGGLSMLMGSSNRGMKRVILDIDRNVYEPSITMLADWNLENSDDDSIKGDMNFFSEGVVSMIMKEQLADRRINFLQATQNEFDMKIIGMDGRAKILADSIEALESDYDDILPSEEKIRALIENEEMLQQQAIRENEAKIREQEDLVRREAEVQMQEAHIEMQKLELEKRAQDLEFKNKERELDIRAQKQTNDLIAEIEKEGLKDEEAGGTPASGVKPPDK